MADVISPLDATGRAKQVSEKANAKAAQDRKDQLSMATKAEKELMSTGTFDPRNQAETINLDEVEQVGVSLTNDLTTIRTQVDIENMTWGVGNNYTFKAGVKYLVPTELADYLAHLGYVWIAS